MYLPTISWFMMLSLLLSTPLVSQSPGAAGGSSRDRAAGSPGALPAGWTARPDDQGDPQEIKFTVMEPGFHLTLGPATILYRAEDRVDAPFHTLATFHQMKKPRHPEGYGLFIGGQQLDKQGQAYTYFLVRGDGKFTIKRREGDKVTQVVDGWKSHPAIKQADANGAASNLLEVDAKIDPKRVSFKANGKEVHSMPAARIETKGVVGLRVNHNLDVHVEGFAVHK